MFAQVLNNISATGDDELRQMVEEEIRAEFERERAAVLQHQQSLAVANVSRTSRGVDGMGFCAGEVPWAVRAYWHARKPGCWKDATFRKEFFRDNPQYASRYERKPMVSLGLPANRTGEIQIFRAGKYARVTEMGGAA
jgi:hypothetical protein